jgi:acyl transferase domain-containing protein
VSTAAATALTWNPLRDELEDALAGVDAVDGTIPIYSTVTGARVQGPELSAAYWWQNFRRPVRFAPAIRAMLDDGVGTFIELSPHPVLANSLRELFADEASDALALASLARDRDDWESFLGAFASVCASGREIEWTRRYPHGAPVLELPRNPWIRERYWNESASSRR